MKAEIDEEIHDIRQTKSEISNAINAKVATIGHKRQPIEEDKSVSENGNEAGCENHKWYIHLSLRDLHSRSDGEVLSGATVRQKVTRSTRDYGSGCEGSFAIETLSGLDEREDVEDEYSYDWDAVHEDRVDEV